MKKIVLLVVICLGAFIFTSCDPTAGYTIIEVIYNDTLLSSNNFVEFKEKLFQNGGEINYDKTSLIWEYKKNGKQIYSVKQNQSSIMDITVLQEKDKYYLCMSIFENHGPNTVRRYKYSYGGIIITEDGDFYEFKRGEIPLIVRDHYIYFFDDIYIYRRDITGVEDDNIACTLPYDTFPLNYNYENPTDYTSPDFVFLTYQLSVSENKIEVIGSDWVNNETVNVVLAEVDI